MRQTTIDRIQKDVIKTLNMFMIGPNYIKIEALSNDQYKLSMQIGELWASTHYFTTDKFNSHYKRLIGTTITTAINYYLFRYERNK